MPSVISSPVTSSPAIAPIKAIPTNVITGFLGTGKTTAILDLLRRKPATEKWAVLVNEFGEIGIDGKILRADGVEIREVAGGCMCCAAGLPMKVALNTLITRVKPDRLLIEPTGLGHPQEIVDTLTGEYYGDVLDLRALIALVDPRKLRDPRYTGHAIFRDQLQLADIVVANKTDLADADDERAFTAFVAQLTPQKQATGWVSQGLLELDWLQFKHGGQRIAPPRPAAQGSLLQRQPALPAPVELAPGEPSVRRENSGDGFFSCGWLFAEDIRFDFQQLLSLLSGLAVRRLKGVLRTDRGAYIFNADDGVLGINDIGGDVDSVLEIIDDQRLDWPALEAQLLALRCP